jgi:hypothetical protein
MPTLTDEQRQEFVKAWLALDARDAEIQKARAPIDAQLRPFILQAMEVEEAREALIDGIGTDFIGKCESCGKPLFSGDQGSRPYGDETSIIFCAEHGMTYADLLQSWKDTPVADDDEERADMRAIALVMVETHVNAGGALTDLVPPYEL